MIAKGVLLSNIKDLSNVGYMDRFMYNVHLQDTLSIMSPLLARWEISRSETSMMPEDIDTDAYGAYNWTVVELQFTENPYADKKGMGGAGSALDEWFPDDYNEKMGLPAVGEFKRVASWPGTKDVRMNAMTNVPLRPTESFVGDGLTIEDGPFLRWVQMIRYPEGMDKDVCEDWYLNTHCPEAAKMPGLKRFISFKKLPGAGAFDRITEMWFEDAESWRNAVITNPPKFSAPPEWATSKTYPFFEPFTHFVSTFILERATQNLLRDKGTYIYNA